MSMHNALHINENRQKRNLHTRFIFLPARHLLNPKDPETLKLGRASSRDANSPPSSRKTSLKALFRDCLCTT